MIKMNDNNIARLKEEISQALGIKGVVDDAAQLDQMTKPWRDDWISEPGFVVQPNSTREVQAAVDLCREHMFR